jgi:hypothetical protein
VRDPARAPEQVVRIARRLLGLPLVNIGGTDLVGGAHKLLLAILWQLMRFHTRALLQSVAPPGAPPGARRRSAPVMRHMSGAPGARDAAHQPTPVEAAQRHHCRGLGSVTKALRLLCSHRSQPAHRTVTTKQSRLETVQREAQRPAR